MKAAFYDRLGPARDVLQLGETPDPLPAAGEVRVRIQWSGVNPSDVKSRLGMRVGTMPFPRVIPHSDGMGIIDAVGDGVASSRVGQRVWTWNAAWGRPNGTACELVCLPQDQAVPLPDSVAGEVGACLGIPALTALHAVLMHGGVAGKTVFVAGGAGAVGHYAVQMASQLGAARVLTSVSTPEKATLALAAGADSVVMYKTEPIAERVADLTAGRGVDRIIELDLGVNAGADLEMLRPNGECVVYGSSATPVQLPFVPLLVKNLQLKFFIVYHLPLQARAIAVATLTRMLKRGALHHNIAERMPLNDIAAAHELVEQGKLAGNVVLSIPALERTQLVDDLWPMRADGTMSLYIKAGCGPSSSNTRPTCNSRAIGDLSALDAMGEKQRCALGFFRQAPSRHRSGGNRPNLGCTVTRHVEP